MECILKRARVDIYSPRLIFVYDEIMAQGASDLKKHDFYGIILLSVVRLRL
jgi:hypothetical protein